MNRHRSHRRRRCCCVLMLASSTLFIVDQRQVAVVYAFGEIKEVITRAGPELQAAAAVPERRLPRPPHPDARQPRDAADLHRREEEPGDRLAREVAHHRSAPVHPQQRRRHAQPRGAPVARSCTPRSTKRSPSAPCARCSRASATRSCRTCAAASTDDAKSFGIEVVDVRIKRVDFVGQHHRVGLQPHGVRAQAGRQRAALDRRRRGREDPRRRRPPARGDRRRGLPRRAEGQGRGRRQGVGDLSPRRSAAIRSSPSSIAAWRPTGRASATSRDVMVVDPSSDFFRAMRGAGSPAARRAAAAPARGSSDWSSVAFWDVALSALALMLVVEGLLPFLSPAAWRRVFERALQMSDGQIRFLGLVSMLGWAWRCCCVLSWLRCVRRRVAHAAGRYNPGFNTPAFSHVLCLAPAGAHRRCPAGRGAAHRRTAARAARRRRAATASSW